MEELVTILKLKRKRQDSTIDDQLVDDNLTRELVIMWKLKKIIIEVLEIVITMGSMFLFIFKIVIIYKELL